MWTATCLLKNKHINLVMVSLYEMEQVEDKNKDYYHLFSIKFK